LVAWVVAVGAGGVEQLGQERAGGGRGGDHAVAGRAGHRGEGGGQGLAVGQRDQSCVHGRCGGWAGGRLERDTVRWAGHRVGHRVGAAQPPEPAIGHPQRIADRDTSGLQRVAGGGHHRLDAVGGAVAGQHDADAAACG
jgi:hypothetical protein